MHLLQLFIGLAKNETAYTSKIVANDEKPKLCKELQKCLLSVQLVQRLEPVHEMTKALGLFWTRRDTRRIMPSATPSVRVPLLLVLNIDVYSRLCTVYLMQTFTIFQIRLRLFN